MTPPDLTLEEVLAEIRVPPPFPIPEPDDLSVPIGHEYETSDSCGRDIFCRLCRKRIGIRHPHVRI